MPIGRNTQGLRPAITAARNLVKQLEKMNSRGAATGRTALHRQKGGMIKRGRRRRVGRPAKNAGVTY